MKKVLLFLVVVVAVLLVVIQSRPGTFHVERSATIAAPASVVYAQLSNFHAWHDWSPWEKLDPAMKTDFSGPESGVGASYHWVGNDKVGEGRMTIKEAQPDQKVGIALDFIKPFAANNDCSFTLSPEGAGTKVTWAMDGKQTFISKAMCMITPMDKMIGPDFERGLTSLGNVAVANAAAAVPAAPADTTKH